MLCGYVANAQTKAVTIESILVDACGTPEGENEMFKFKVGPNALNTSNLSVKWSSNSWLGVCQDATTARVVAAMNRTINKCGLLLEPTAGVLPAGSEVLFITSENTDTTLYSYANLRDTVYVVFQCGSASTGHFKNYQAGAGGRTTILTFSGLNGGSDTATYIVDSLTDQTGHHTAQDGAAVEFTTTGTNYYNYGCTPLFKPFSVQILNNDTNVCAGSQIALNAVATNYKTLSWKGGTGTFTFVDSLHTIYTPGANEVNPVKLILRAFSGCAGDSVADTLALTVNALDVVTVLKSKDTVCQGGTLTLNANSNNGYSWAPSSGLSCNNCATPSYTPSASSVITVSSLGTCPAQKTVDVTVIAQSSVSIANNNTNLTCSNPGVTLTASSTTGGLSYNWGGGITTAANTVSGPGTYTVTATEPLFGCSATATATVGQNVTAPNASIAQHGTLSCVVSSVALSASSTTPNATFNWGGGVNTATNNINAVGNYTVTVTDPANGCTATATTSVTSTGATVNLTPSSGNATCGQQNGTASVTATSGTSPFSYSWSNLATTQSINNLSAGTVSVTVTDAGGCSAVASINVSASNGLNVSVTSTNTSCGANNGTATVQPTSGNAPYTFHWANNDTSATAQNLAAGTYVVTTSDAAGCSTTSSVVVGSSSSINVTISADKNVICSSDSSHICAPAGYAHYKWNNGVTTSCISTSNPGNYYVTVTDNSNCTAESNHLAISVHPLPPVSISVNGDTLRVYNEPNVQWYKDGVAIPGANSAVYIATTPGIYTVAVTDANGCTANSTPTLVNGLGEIEQDEVIIYPNPSNDGNWNINVVAELIGSELELYDDNGRLVYKTQIHDMYNHINVNIARGVYLARIYTENATTTRKLIRF
jgi:hypothetical protein